MIRLENIHFSYGKTPFLAGLSLKIAEGELHGVIGPNGAGKSTLLRIMGGLLKPAAGRVQVNGKDLATVPPHERARTAAFVFQENYTGFPFTVRQMVLMGRHPYHQSTFTDSPDDARVADEMLRLLNMETMADRLFRTLSGGEKQRVAIAAALAQKTPVLLFDEPTAFTDIRFQSDIYRLVHKIAKTQDLTTVVITHDINLASLYCDTISIIQNGAVLATGKPSEILTEALLSRAYSTEVKIISHPEAGVPLVVPVIR